MADAIQPETPAARSDDLIEVHDRALRRFDSVAVPQAEMRAQALDARRFVTIPGAMWEGAWGEQWENTPRPEIDKITKSLEKIETDYRENRLTADFVPANDDADSETAETLDGMHRADSYHFKAMQARDNAFQEGIRGGFGAWRLATDYANPEDPDDETQRINPGLVIVDADQSVYFDGASKLYDKSDANWAFVITADPRAVAEEMWGADRIAEWPTEGFKYHYQWYAPDVVRTAEYYEVERVAEKRLTFRQKLSEETQSFWESEIDSDQIGELADKGWEKTEKSARRRSVRKYILNGSQVLKDCGYIAGDRIPIVPFYGRRDFVDNMERFRGHVHKKMDRQRLYNASVARVAEIQSISPIDKPVFDPSQITPELSEEWARSNIDRLPFLRALALRNEDGSIAQAGPIGKVDAPQVQPATAALLQISSADLADDDQNVEEVKANTSAEAMDIAASRVDAKSAIYLDNMRQSIQLEAEIYLGMAREVYFEEGRKVDTLTADQQDGTAVLLEGVIDRDGAYRVRNDLSRGKYKVVADVQESTSTKQQKTVRQALELASAFTTAQSPQDALAALYMATQNMDGEGIGEFKDYIRKKSIAIGATKPTEEEAQELAQQAQQNSQPDPAQQVLMGQAQKLAADAKLSEAKALETVASAGLKHAQTEAVGGPAQEPGAPTGLHDVEIEEKSASANLRNAQAEAIRHGIGEKRIRLGHEIEMDRREQAA